jgi:DNA-binding transcriptional LysR family regulator
MSMELDNIEAIKRMVSAGFGVSILPRLALEEMISSHKIAALPLLNSPAAQQQIAFVYRTDKYVSSPLAALIDLLKEGVGG